MYGVRAMEQRIVPGAVVEHAGQRWRVDRVLGADAVLLRGEDGSPVVADPARVTFPGQATESRTSLPPVDAVQCTEADWAEAVRRRDLVLRLARRRDHTSAEIDAVASALGPGAGASGNCSAWPGRAVLTSRRSCRHGGRRGRSASPPMWRR
jgi:hypothetical protein